jgi:hypothetical protein
MTASLKRPIEGAHHNIGNPLDKEYLSVATVNGSPLLGQLLNLDYESS